MPPRDSVAGGIRRGPEWPLAAGVAVWYDSTLSARHLATYVADGQKTPLFT